MKREADVDVGIAIEMAAMCETFHCLPKSGGLFDQDPLHLIMMREVIIAQREKAEAERKQVK
jgi:hypothetical protein